MGISANIFTSSLALLIGILSIIASLLVLIGKSMNYKVIDWLLIYNLILGILSTFFTSILIWQGNQIALPATLTTLVSHSVVLLLLKTRFRDDVAKQSVRAMIFRIIVWLIITYLLIV